MSAHLTRRDFLQATAGVGAVASFGSPFAPAEANAATAATAAAQTNAATFPPLAGWLDRPMRWVQLTLVENDPGRFDPDKAESHDPIGAGLRARCVLDAKSPRE